MDKALDFSSKDCGLESHRGYLSSGARVSVPPANHAPSTREILGHTDTPQSRREKDALRVDVDPMDTLGFEPRAFRMRSGCDATTPCAHTYEAAKQRYAVGRRAAIPIRGRICTGFASQAC